MKRHTLNIRRHPAGLTEAQVLDLVTLTQDVFAAEFARAIEPVIESINAALAKTSARSVTYRAKTGAVRMTDRPPKASSSSPATPPCRACLAISVTSIGGDSRSVTGARSTGSQDVAPLSDLGILGFGSKLAD